MSKDEPKDFVAREYPNEEKIESCGVSIVKFSDISGNAYEDYIIELEEISGLNGNGDGSEFSIFNPESKAFQPSRFASRSEFIKMVLRALCIDYSDMSSSLDNFSDTETDSWQAKVVNKAADLGWITTTNNEFRVNQAISRIEALKIVMQAGILSPLETPVTSSFTDVQADSWMARYTEAAISFDIIAPNTTFRPEEAITRGESAKLIIRVMK